MTPQILIHFINKFKVLQVGRDATSWPAHTTSTLNQFSTAENLDGKGRGSGFMQEVHDAMSDMPCTASILITS